jgi:hypothetical protein
LRGESSRHCSKSFERIVPPVTAGERTPGRTVGHIYSTSACGRGLTR